MALVIIFSISTPCNYPIVVWIWWYSPGCMVGVLMSVGVMTVGVECRRNNCRSNDCRSNETTPIFIHIEHTFCIYIPIFSCIFLSNYWWQKSGIWSQASYRYPISWETFFDPSDSYFLFAEERGYHRSSLAHSSSCLHLYPYLLIKYDIHFCW